jgi:hypothetical protein
MTRIRENDSPAIPVRVRLPADNASGIPPRTQCSQAVQQLAPPADDDCPLPVPRRAGQRGTHRRRIKSRISCHETMQPPGQAAQARLIIRGHGPGNVRCRQMLLRCIFRVWTRHRTNRKSSFAGILF